MNELMQLELRTLRQWHGWLAHNHSSSAGVWLVFRKDKAGKPFTYEAALREALCFGWIDSLVKRLDDERYVRKFTPRRPGSKWSDINRKHWAELKAAGLLMGSGLAAAPTDNSYDARPEIPELPDYIADAFSHDAKAWAFFQGLPRAQRRRFVTWIHIAKRPDTREKRIRESIELLSSGQKLGLR